MTKEPYRYKLSYTPPEAHPEGILAEELQAKGLGGTDALFMASILYPPDGSLSMLFLSLDGRTGKEMDDNEWFKVFTLLSKRLSDSKTLQPGKKAFAALVFEMFQEVMLGKKPEEHCDHPECATNPGHNHDH